MSQRLRKHAKTLHFLTTTDGKTAKSVIRSANPEVLNCFSEVCHNILEDRIHLVPKKRAKLAKYRATIRALAKKSTTQQTKRQLIQKGGFLSAILPILGAVLPGIAGALFGK